MHYHLFNLLASLAPVYSGLRLRFGSPALPTASGSASNKVMLQTRFACSKSRRYLSAVSR